MAEITRTIAGQSGATKSGNAVVMTMSAPITYIAEFQWDETCPNPAEAPQITAQKFHIGWPTITGTAYANTSLTTYLAINRVSIEFEHVGQLPGGEYTPAMVINDGAGYRSVPYDAETQSWVLIEQGQSTTVVSVGPDGSAWTQVAAAARNPGDQLERFVLSMWFGSSLSGDPPDPVTGSMDNWSPALPAFGTTTLETGSGGGVDYNPDPDPFDQDASAPFKEGGKTTLLELVREFSSEVRRPVRITGPDTIYMIPLNAQLIGGLTQSDATHMYTDTTLSLSSDENVLRTRTGNLVLEGSASMVTNDARLITTGWRIPYRLPVYSLKPSPVKRVAFTFTPDDFSAQVDFHLPAVPYGVGRGEA